jgi:hypothetical protein
MYRLFEYVLPRVMKDRNLTVSCTMCSMPPIYCLADKNEHAMRRTQNINAKQPELRDGFDSKSVEFIFGILMFCFITWYFW